MMHLVIDIGNSSAKVGLWDGAAVVKADRMEADSDELAEFLDGVEVGAAGAVSVVPGENKAWSVVVKTATRHALRFFDHMSALPVEIGYETPRTLGADRIAAAVGGFLDPMRQPGQTTIVVDAGTALNMEIVTPDGLYPGGIIAPGPELLRSSLRAGTAQLPLVELIAPQDLVGRSTDEAMRSGILWGFRETVAGLIARVHEGTGEPFVVATGGWAPWLSEHVTAIDVVRPHLVLRGVAALLGGAVPKDGVNP